VVLKRRRILDIDDLRGLCQPFKNSPLVVTMAFPALSAPMTKLSSGFIWTDDGFFQVTRFDKLQTATCGGSGFGQDILVPFRMIAETLGDLRFSWQDRF